MKRDFDPLVELAAQKYGLPKDRLAAVIAAESAWNPNAKSPAGAQGLMQLMPATAKELGVKDPFDPAQNIDAGARYLRQQYDTFGDWDKAHAAYNAGPGNVRKYGGVPPFKEPQNYIKKINATLKGNDMKEKPNLGNVAEGLSIDAKLKPEQVKKKFSFENAMDLGGTVLGAVSALLQQPEKHDSLSMVGMGGGGAAPIVGGQSYNAGPLQKQYGMQTGPYSSDAVFRLLRGGMI